MTIVEQINSDSEIVETIGEYAFTRAELTTLFNRVANSKNWKLAVDAVVILADPRERIGLHVAIRFFTGSVATLEYLGAGGLGSSYRVKAAGYYAAVGA